MSIHRIIREGDEFTCTCGLRWDVKEKDPHVKLNGREVSLKKYIDTLNRCDHVERLPSGVTTRLGFDLAQLGSDRTVKAMFENGELKECTVEPTPGIISLKPIA